MRRTGRVRPSKPASAIGLVFSIVFVCVGIFVAIPHMGLFGLLWTVAAVVGTGYHAVNLFSEHGVAHEVVDFDTPPQSQSHPPPQMSPEQRLSRLEGLRSKGLISDEEYEQQRERILNDL